MSTCYIETPLGNAKIVGDNDGVSSVSILNTIEKISESIPEELSDCVSQLKAYFNNELQHFD